jgi:hypothetical protein
MGIDSLVPNFYIINAKAINEMKSPPPLPSPLEGEGWVRGKYLGLV